MWLSCYRLALFHDLVFPKATKRDPRDNSVSLADAMAELIGALELGGTVTAANAGRLEVEWGNREGQPRQARFEFYRFPLSQEIARMLLLLVDVYASVSEYRAQPPPHGMLWLIGAEFAACDQLVHKLRRAQMFWPTNYGCAAILLTIGVRDVAVLSQILTQGMTIADAVAFADLYVESPDGARLLLEAAA